MTPFLNQSLQDMPERMPAWLDLHAGKDQVILFSRIRLLRNLDGIPFPGHGSEALLAAAAEQAVSAITELPCMKDVRTVPAKSCSALDMAFLRERGLISAGFESQPANRHCVFSDDETFFAELNCEDHIRLYGVSLGNSLMPLWHTLSAADDLLASRLPFAFRMNCGFLTADPALSGCAMRAAVALHIPALLLSDEAGKIKNSLKLLGCSCRNMFPGFGDASSPFLQIFCDCTTGENEESVLERLGTVCTRIADRELYLRKHYSATDPERLLNECGRAYGMLRYAYSLKTADAVRGLSKLRMGCDLGIIQNATIPQINRLLIGVQPAHLSCFMNELLTESMQDSRRAALLRTSISSKGTSES